MTQLKWLENTDGFVSGDYYIRRVGDASRYRWHLETHVHSAQQQSGSVTSYASLRDAKGAAHRAEGNRLQRDTVIGHATVALMAVIALAALFPTIGNLTTFVIAMLLFYLGLRSLTFSISAKLGDSWGWTRDGGIAPPQRMSDRMVRAGIAWLRRTSTVAIDTEPTSAVRVLPPRPPG